MLKAFIAATMSACAFNTQAEMLTLEQAQAGVNSILLARTNDASRTLKIVKVLGCIPSMQKPKKRFVCALQISDDSTDALEFSFDKTATGWQAQLEDVDAACAPLKVAQVAFIKLTGDKNLRVFGEVDDGEGLFTADRGMTQNRKGAYRLMCRYEVKTATNPDALFLTYVWHDGTNYVIDADVERW